MKRTARSKERAAFGADGRGGTAKRTNLRIGSKRGQTHTGSHFPTRNASAGLGIARVNPSTVTDAEVTWIRALYAARDERIVSGEWSAKYRRALEAARYARQVYERVRREAGAS